MTRKSLRVIKSEILVRACAGTYPRIQKCIFRARAHGPEFLQENSHDSNLGRSSDECMAITVLKHPAEGRKLALIFSTRTTLVFRRSTSLGHMVDVEADVNHML